MRAQALRGFTVLLVLFGVACQGAAPAPPTTAPAAPPTPAPTKPAVAASPSVAASPAASPSPAAAASPKPAVSPAASPSAAVAAASPSPSPAATGRVINFDASDYAYTLPDTIAAGQVTFVMRNVGQVAHQAQLMK